METSYVFEQVFFFFSLRCQIKKERKTSILANSFTVKTGWYNSEKGREGASFDLKMYTIVTTKSSYANETIGVKGIECYVTNTEQGSLVRELPFCAYHGIQQRRVMCWWNTLLLKNSFWTTNYVLQPWL
ncbi:hypothetical protein CEXT_378881 [Caerostris extrusa]|uniref:Uncharacterized protein n=1 Tax=Caerostris extrusa TaxID=172846 RepID=A0AAV4WRF6_CAEEX|nr:hypothetical protein CEXT_378881 [Caerostris extrusa]